MGSSAILDPAFAREFAGRAEAVDAPLPLGRWGCQRLCLSDRRWDAAEHLTTQIGDQLDRVLEVPLCPHADEAVRMHHVAAAVLHEGHGPPEDDAVPIEDVPHLDAVVVVGLAVDLEAVVAGGGQPSNGLLK